MSPGLTVDPTLNLLAGLGLIYVAGCLENN